MVESWLVILSILQWKCTVNLSYQLEFDQPHAEMGRNMTLTDYYFAYNYWYIFTHSVTSTEGTEDVHIIISNAVNINVSKRIATEQTVDTAYIYR